MLLLVLDLRRRHGLLAAAGPPIPRGAAAWGSRAPPSQRWGGSSGDPRPPRAAVSETGDRRLDGGTVIAAMLVLLVADLESTHWLGPVLAIGIAVMLAAAFTLLPALLAILGERAFWPASPAQRRGSAGVPGGTSQFVTERTPLTRAQPSGNESRTWSGGAPPDHPRRPRPADRPLRSATSPTTTRSGSARG